MDDQSLIAEYVDRHSEEAFTSLVHRYYGLVFSSAFRRVGDRTIAADVAQTVFVLLASQAARLRGRSSIAGWLHLAAGLKAREHGRAESRRRLREHLASTMDLPPSSSETDAAWHLLEPLLDEALESFKPADREAVLLRFFQNRGLREVGTALGIPEDTARKRIARSIESLRTWFHRRGITVPTAILGAAMSAHGSEPVTNDGITFVAHTALRSATPVTLSPFLKSLLLMTSIKIPLVITGVAVAILLLATRHRSVTQKAPFASLADGNRVTVADAPGPRILRRASIWVRSAGPSHPLDPVLESTLARLRAALFRPGRDAELEAKQLLTSIPLNQRGAALKLIGEALDHADLETCERGVRLLPLVWPDGEAALPKLWDLLATRSGESLGLSTEIFVSALQVAAYPGTIQELAAAALKGPPTVVNAFILDFPLLRSLVPGNDDTWRSSLQPFLYSPDSAQRLTAATALANLPGPANPLALTTLTGALTELGPGSPGAPTANSILGALAAMGPNAVAAVPSLQQLVTTHPEWTDLINQTLKAIKPADWTGIGVPTPLPPHDTASAALLQGVKDGTVDLGQLIAAIGSNDTTLAAARALADFGTNAAAALPALGRALDQATARDPATAVVLAATMERLDPSAPKPLVPFNDLTTALGAVLTAAQDNTQWVSGITVAARDAIYGGLMTQTQLANFAVHLGAIDPSLRNAFSTALKNIDARYASVLAPGP